MSPLRTTGVVILLAAVLAVPTIVFFVGAVRDSGPWTMAGSAGIFVAVPLFLLGFAYWLIPASMGMSTAKPDGPGKEALGDRVASARAAWGVPRFGISWPLVGLSVHHGGLVVSAPLGRYAVIPTGSIRAVVIRPAELGSLEIEIRHDSEALRSPTHLWIPAWDARRLRDHLDRLALETGEHRGTESRSN